MKKYLYLPCVAILALAACDESGSADQQSQAGTPSVTETAVQENYGKEGLEAVAEIMPIAPAVIDIPAAAGMAPPEGDTAGNAGPDAGMSAEATPPAPSPETFNEGAAKKKLDPDKSCGDYTAWVGHPLDEEAVKATNDFARIMKPGDPMTMDHIPDRVNVEHDDANIVTRVWCG